MAVCLLLVATVARSGSKTPWMERGGNGLGGLSIKTSTALVNQRGGAGGNSKGEGGLRWGRSKFRPPFGGVRIQMLRC